VDQSRDIAGELSKQGYRLTPQRLMILVAIENSDDHISAEEIYSQVVAKYPNVNISTVYRTLELLKRLGLATETDLGEGRVRYHPAGKGHHHHLVCRECGATGEYIEPFVIDPMSIFICMKMERPIHIPISVLPTILIFTLPNLAA